MTNLRPRDGESFVQARKRLMDLVQAVRAAEPPIPDHPDRKAWAAVSKPRDERLKAALIGKVRRVFHTLNPGQLSSLESESTRLAMRTMANTSLQAHHCRSQVPMRTSRMAARQRRGWIFGFLPRQSGSPSRRSVTCGSPSARSIMSDDKGKRDACLLLDRALYSLGVEFGRVETWLAAQEGPQAGDIIAFQEVQRREPGWLPTCEVGHFALVRHQGVANWRGIAVAINTRKFVILKKKACDHAVWVQLQDKSSTRKLWVCSLYLSTGIPLDEYQLQFRRALELLPANADIALAIGDLNVALGWKMMDNGTVESTGSSRSYVV